MRRFICKVMVMACVAAAQAGDVRVLSPDQGGPALLLRGGEFSVRVTERAELALVSGELRVPLDGVWTRNGTACAARVPDDALPGKYALAAGHALNHNAVFVYDAFPARYTIACVPAPAAFGPAAFEQVVQRINGSGAALAIFLGPLTKTGAVEELERAAEALRACSVPTLITPGPDDIAGGAYERYFGGGWRGVRFGEDAYLSLNSADLLPMDELGQGPAEIQRYRRENRDARWTIAFTNRLPARSGLRTLLTLFVDDPADFVLSNDGLLRRKDLDPVAIGATPAPFPRTEDRILLVDIGTAGPALPDAADPEKK